MVKPGERNQRRGSDMSERQRTGSETGQGQKRPQQPSRAGDRWDRSDFEEEDD